MYRYKKNYILTYKHKLHVAMSVCVCVYADICGNFYPYVYR